MKKIILLFLTLGLCLAQGDYELAKKHYDSKEYDKAYKLLNKACNDDEMKACSLLGLMYADGSGTQKDYKKARQLYAKACDGGDAKGCLYLGLLCENEKEDNKAAEFYKKACDLGEYSGCYSLGLMQAKNNETKMALRNQAKACLAPLNEACNELKNLYEKFKDEEHKKANNYKKDFDEALKMYNSGKEAQAVLSLKKLCKVGFDDACIKLYKAYQKGSEKISQDTQKALLVLDKACINSMAKSCAKLGEIYSQDDGEFTADTQKAQDYLNKACDSFDGDSCFALASDLEASCSQNDEKCQMVFGLYKKACALGSLQACKNANAIEVGLPFLRF